MRELDVDVAVIGAGTAGLSALRAARKRTDRVVMIEGGPHGTTCARVGCMPSKLLIAAAEAAHAVTGASRFGVNAPAPQIDGRAVMDRVRRERDRFAGFVVRDVEEMPAHIKVQGYARFLDDHRLQVDDHTLVHAKSVVIATGSSPHIPQGFAELGDRLVINDDVFDWVDLPQSVAVFGAGVIGLELGQALHRLGVRVRLFGRGNGVGPLTDPDVKAYALKTFAAEMPFVANSELLGFEPDDHGVTVHYKVDGQEHREHFEKVLAATGRRPNLKGLDLARTSLQLDGRGVPHFDAFTMQCGEQAIFIAGDVDNQRPLLHEAADEGRIAGDNAARFPDVRAGLRRSALGVVFSDPQIAMVGCRFDQLPDDAYAVGSVSFENQGRSRVMLVNQGLLRVYGEHGSGRFLGAEMVGPRAEHLSHLLAWCHQQQLTVQQMLDMPYYHPVIEEGLRTALRVLSRQLKLGPAPVPRCLDCGPGA